MMKILLSLAFTKPTPGRRKLSEATAKKGKKVKKMIDIDPQNTVYFVSVLEMG